MYIPCEIQRNTAPIVSPNDGGISEHVGLDLYTADAVYWFKVVGLHTAYAAYTKNNAIMILPQIYNKIQNIHFQIPLIYAMMLAVND